MTDMVICTSVVTTHGASSFYQTRKAVSGILLFILWTFLHVPQMHFDFFVAWGGNLVPFLVDYKIKCYIVLIHLSVLLPTEYSVLGYSTLDNQMHYEK